jgi:hypothetical protein
MAGKVISFSCGKNLRRRADNNIINAFYYVKLGTYHVLAYFFGASTFFWWNASIFVREHGVHAGPKDYFVVVVVVICG